MNCQDVYEKLSAYFDRELDATTVTSIEQHLAQCNKCKECLNEYQQLRELVKSRRESAIAIPSWESIACRLDEQSSLMTLSTKRARVDRRSIVGTFFAVAALLLVMLGYFSQKPSKLDSKVQASVASIDFKPVIDLFRKDPTLALAHLTDQFSSEVVSIEKAESHFGRPVFARTSRTGDAQLVSTRILKFPYCKCPEGQCKCGPGGCNCVACVCQRPDGSSYLVLEHCKAQGVTFGDLPVQIVRRGTQQLQQVTVDGLTTVSWEGNGGRVTAIGLQNDREIDTLLASN